LTIHPFPGSFVRRAACAARRSGQMLNTGRHFRFVASKLLVLSALSLLVAGYSLAGVPVTLEVDGHLQRWRTHQATVAGLLREANVDLHPADIVSPLVDTRLAPGSVVTVRLARPVMIEADGNRVAIRTQRRQMADVLVEAGITLKPHDDVLIDGQPWQMDADLPAPDPDTHHDGRGLATGFVPPPALRVVLRRSIPVTLIDGEVPVIFYTTRPTIGEALLSEGILLYLGDRVSPSLGSPVLAGVTVHIQRSTPCTIHVDGHTLHTRTQRATVGSALAQEGILLVGKDFTLPPDSARITDSMTIQVVRVQEALKVEEQLIPFETNWVPSPDMPIDTQQMTESGEAGLTRRRYRITYENGRQVSNALEDEWLDGGPTTKIIAYGTKVTVQTMETPDGTIEYWRHFRALATAYTAATAGKSRDHPQYGITRTGMKAGHGVIAVDPKVISLGSRVYVPGYGGAIAGDTGSSVVGRHVDLGFDDDKPPPSLYRWVDVYLLTPVPPPGQIPYVLPNWPQER
jgi:uncharacterized protein YabE (DUF348 family)